MRHFAFLCLAFLPLLPARAASAADRLPRQAQYVDPCRDGRISDGKARSCAEIRHWLHHRDRDWERRPRRHERYDPCTDGTVSDGRPRTCRELRRWYYDPGSQDWD